MKGDDQSQVNVVSRLEVETTTAVKGIRDLGLAFRGLGTEIKATEAAFKKAIPGLLQPIDQQMLRSTETLEQALKSRVKTLRELASEVNLSAAQGGKLVDQHGKPIGLTERSGAVDLSRQVQRAQERAAATAAAMLPKLEAQLALTQRRLKEEGMSGVHLSSQAKAIREQVKHLQERLQVSGKLSNLEASQVRALQQQTATLRAQAATLRADRRGGADFVESALERRLGWFATGAGLFGAINAAKAGLSTVAQMERQMTDLTRVMNDQTYSAGKMRESLTSLGEEYGATFDVTSEIATKWAQSGKDMQQTLEATEATLLALNTAEMDTKSGTEGLIGIMSQWQMQTSEMVGVIDQLNITADRNNITTQDLVDGLLRSGSAAKNAGLSFKENIALLTAMREASGRAGKEVGNALNSILSFMQREKALATFEQAGIQVYADKAQGKLLPLIDILGTIAANWGQMGEAAQDALAAEADAAGLFSEEMADAIGAQETWNDLQKRDISNAAAAAFRRNYLLALLGNFTKVQEVLNGLEEAHGYSMRENERTMETYEKKVAQLRASLEGVAAEFASESGVLDGLKGAVDGLRSGVQAWGDLDDATQSAVISMAGVGSALIALNMGLTRMAQVNIVGAVAALGNYIRTVGAAAAATRALSALTATLFSPTGLLILGGTLLAGGAAFAKTRAKEAEDARRDAQRQADELERLRTRYLALAKQTDLTKEQQVELHSVSKQLAELMPQLATRFDAAGNAILKVGEVAEQTSAKIASLREDAQSLIEEEAAVGRERLPALEADLRNLERLYEKYRSAVLEGPDAVRRVGSPRFDENVVMPLMPDEQIMKMAEGWLAHYRSELEKTTTEIERYRKAVEGPFIGPPHLPYTGPEKGSSPKVSPVVSTVSATAQARSVAEAILTEVKALEALGAATERDMSLRQERITHLTREGVTIDELNQADYERADLLSLLTKRQQQLHGQATEARAAIQRLRDVQATLNVSTDEGKSAFEYLASEIERLTDAAGAAEKPVGRLSAEWWKLEQQKTSVQRENNAVSRFTLERLAELQQAYESGALSLEDYVTALQSLAAASDLSSAALKSLYEAQGKAQAELWSRQLEEALEGGRKALERFGEALDGVFSGYENAARQRSLDALVKKLQETSGSVRSLLDAMAGPSVTPTLMVAGDGLSENARSAAQSALSLIERIASGAFRPDGDSLLALERDKFLSAVSQAVGDLEATGLEVNQALAAIARDRDKVIAGITASAQGIRDVLNDYEQTGRQQTREDSLDRFLSSLDALRGVTPIAFDVPEAGDLERLAESVRNIRVDDLGKLEPDAFSAALRENLAGLRSASQSVQAWTRGIGDGIAYELTAVEEAIRRIDQELQGRLKALQAQLDALDDAEKGDERAKAQEEYNSRVKALQEERQWLMLQGEADNAFRIAAIDKQLVDERAKWSETQTKWSREDQRERIRDQMDAAREEAEARKVALESQRAALQEQQQLLNEALRALSEYVAGEEQGLRELAQSRLEDLDKRRDEVTEKYGVLQQALSDVGTYINSELEAWQRLSDERKRIEQDTWNNEESGIRRLMQDGITNTLADMAARDPEWRDRGTAMMNALIEGVRSKQGELQAEINAAMSLMSEIRESTAATYGVAHSLLAPQYSAKQGVRPMAEGGYVKGGMGGILAWVAEKQHDELVLPIPKVRPIIADAMRDVMAQRAASAGSISPQSIASAINSALANVPFTGVFDIRLPDGTVERQVIRLMSGLTPHIRSM